MGSFGGKSPAGQTTTTQTQNTQPWSTQIPYLQQAFQGAQNLYQNYTPQYYPASTVSPINELQNLPLGNFESLTKYLTGAPLMDTLGALQNITTGGAFSGNPAVSPLTTMAGTNIGLNNPGASTLGYFASGAATDPFLSNVAQSVAANVIPTVDARYIGGGGLSGAGPTRDYAAAQGMTAALAPIMSNAMLQEQQNQLAAGGALSNAALAGAGLQTQQLGDIGNLFSTSIQQQLGAAGLLPQTIQAAYAPSWQEMQAGNYYQQLQQAQLMDPINRWNFQQTLPYQQLNNFLDAIRGNYGGTSTGTAQQPYYTNTLGSLASLGSLGLLAAGPMGFGLWGAGSAAGGLPFYGPWGAGSNLAGMGLGIPGIPD